MMKSRYSKVESLKVMGHPSTEWMASDIELLLWNVFKCRKTGWKKDFLSLIGGKDLILLQEAIANSPYDAIFTKSQQYQWFMARSFRHTQSDIEHGVSTGATVSPTQKYFAASTHSEPFTRTKKMFLATKYPLEGKGRDDVEKALLVVNSHLINFVSFSKFKAHLDQVFETLEGHNGPIILAGDFNTWNGKRLRYFSQLTDSFSLNEVAIRRRPKLSHLFQHLDHIYCRGLEAKSVHVHTDIRSSDHFPISVSLRISTEQN